ncbi:putative deoxyhypusine hydroxylase [Skeletonema marinoi]|uniref:Deoxyhypusine hydroxylase n=1 Tax=Skeletonema marinoi TaxID=267567 RepID=A0AAD8YGA6_9STRA|nr:putative deoxyhypusine hydroxylase [Skeletonema marinoi]
MGQLRDERSISALEKTLRDDNDDIMVRHECAEALGAIGSSRSIETLEVCAKDKSIEVGQTCQLALDFIRWKISGGTDSDENAPIACACMISPYSSVDPAPPHPKHAGLSTAEIGTILNDESAPLFERFQYLEISLKRDNEHRMVRHESAEALGAIEERWGECELILEQFLNDRDDVVRESCVVALDAADYWGYANPSVDEGENEASEVENQRTNFSIHKAETNGMAKTGVLINHFNIAD